VVGTVVFFSAMEAPEDWALQAVPEATAVMLACLEMGATAERGARAEVAARAAFFSETEALAVQEGTAAPGVTAAPAVQVAMGAMPDCFLATAAPEVLGDQRPLNLWVFIGTTPRSNYSEVTLSALPHRIGGYARSYDVVVPSRSSR
jgi:hypothetical protein